MKRTYLMTTGIATLSFALGVWMHSTVLHAQPSKGSQPAKAPPVRVGLLLPMTGQDAINGQIHLNAFSMARDEINEAGGIKCLGGAPIELVVGDTQGKPETGNAEIERLIAKEKVIAVEGAFHTGVTLPTTEISEKYEIPYIVPNAIAGAITSRGLKYVFKPRVAVESETKATVDYAVARGAKTVVVVTANITIGEEARKAWSNWIKGSALQLLDNIQITSGAPDFSDTIQKIKAKSPDVLFVLSNTADAIIFARQMKEANYWPKMALITAGGGWSDANLVKNLGKDADGVFVTTDWSPKVNLPGGGDINAKFKAKFGVDLVGGTNTSYAALHLLAAALEKSCSRDPKALANALRTTDFKTGKWNFMFPDGIKFDSTGYVEKALVLIGQIQNGEQMIIWPDKLALRKATWPVPGWKDRK
jgi:branched-chain amino acid transport system substrate-binding protein